MDWGGLIAGAMGGGAQAIGEIADNTMKQRDLEAASQRMEQRAIEGEKRRSLLARDQFDYEANKKLQEKLAADKRYADDYDKVDSKAKEIGTNRDVQAANKVAPSVDAEVLDIIKSKLSPEDVSKHYGVAKRTGSGLVQDKIEAARELGADPKLREDLRNDYKDAQKSETSEAILGAKVKNQEAILEFKQAQLQLSEAKTRQEIGIANQRLELAKDKLENGGSRAENLNGIAANLGTVLKQKEEAKKDLMMASDAEKPAIIERIKALELREAKFGTEQDRQLDGRAARGDKPTGKDKPAAPQDVRVNGKVIGKASSPEEAKAIFDQWKKSQKK
jgi:hypothetical protein